MSCNLGRGYSRPVVYVVEWRGQLWFAGMKKIVGELAYGLDTYNIFPVMGKIYRRFDSTIFVCEDENQKNNEWAREILPEELEGWEVVTAETPQFETYTPQQGPCYRPRFIKKS